MATYRILSLDGGGVRGILTAALIQRLENAYEGFLEHVDLFAGTSTGGILALGLAAGIAPATIIDLYENKGAFVFQDSLLDDVLDGYNTIGAKFSNSNLKQALKDIMGDQTLGDLNKRVLVASFDLDNKGDKPETIRSWKPKFFHNFETEDPAEHDRQEKVVDVALRTSAAPVYFPVYDGYIDGGVVANNPTMCALAQALDEETGQQDITDILLLSISTGRNPRYIKQKQADWGWAQWIWQLRLVGIMLEGGSDVANYQCQRILGKDRYHRLNPYLSRPVGLDDWKAAEELKRVAHDDSLRQDSTEDEQKTVSGFTEALKWLENTDSIGMKW